MSQTVHCEKCGKKGTMLLRYRGPIGWRFAEVVVDEEGDPKEITIVFACSEVCSVALWRPISELRSAMRDDAASTEEPVLP